MTKDRGPDDVIDLMDCLRAATKAIRHKQPAVPEVPCCTVNNCVGVQRAKQGEGCPVCPSRPKEER